MFGREETMKVRWRLVPYSIAIVIAAIAVPAAAQDYPARPVTIVVPFTPAGTTDILARLIGQHLEQRLGKPFLVENRPGAGMQIGTTAVAKSAPDGYTLLVAPSSALAVNVTLYKKLPYDPVKDLTPIALLAHLPFVLVVNPSLPVKSVAELIAYAKERPGQLSFGSGGVGASHHLYGELLKSLAGIQMTHVPYKGTVPALNDVVAGHIPLLFSDVPPALQLIRTGKVRALGVTTAKRIAVAPDVPPIGETVAGFDSAPWQMLATRAGTPSAITGKLHAEVEAIIASPEIQKQMTEMGLVPGDASTLMELQRFLASEIDRWGKIVHLAGAAGIE
jgi:tripartite-type tricarboxylate transporter receptor subunit TctC